MSASLTSVKTLAASLAFWEKMELIAYVSKTAGNEGSSSTAVPDSPVRPKKAAAEAPPAPKKAKKVKDPNAPKKEPSEWLLFGEKVRAAIRPSLPEGAKIPGPVWMQTASALKEKGLMPSATNEQILAAYQERLAHPPAPKEKAVAEPSPTKGEVESEVESTASSQKKRGRKAKKDMTPEELAAHNARVAAKKAAKVPAPSNAAAAAAVPLPAEVGEELLDFEPFDFKVKAVKEPLHLLRNKRGDVLSEDMEWYGHQNADGSIDTAAKQPEDLDL
uniref:HMG box domain-containing protein n=1 Tax=viral metagenome TaxID=1070528 RepID=A0A6C0BK61_9ZZZZ